MGILSDSCRWVFHIWSVLYKMDINVLPVLKVTIVLICPHFTSPRTNIYRDNLSFREYNYCIMCTEIILNYLNYLNS